MRERWRAASRVTSTQESPGAGSSCRSRFARPRYPLGCPTSGGLRRGALVRIDVHGSKDRVKDASPNAGDSCLSPSRVHAPCRACRQRSPPQAPFGHPESPARSSSWEDTHHDLRTGPGPRSERRPAKSAAVPRTGMPSTATDTEDSRRDRSLRPPRRSSRSRRPHVIANDHMLFVGHCKAARRSPAGARLVSRVRTPFLPAGARAWD